MNGTMIRTGLHKDGNMTAKEDVYQLIASANGVTTRFFIKGI